jgi:hypothetical protein
VAKSAWTAALVLTPWTQSTIGDGTAVELNPDGDPIVDFFGGTFGLNMSEPDVIFLQTNGGTKSDWLALIADRSNWIEQSSQPSGDLFTAAPAAFAGTAVAAGRCFDGAETSPQM